MKRVLYISLLDTNPEVLPYSGVMKKIMLHIDAFKSYGNDVDYIETDETHIYFNSNGIRQIIGNYCESGFLYYNRIFQCAANYVRKNNLTYDYIYVRHSALNIFGFRALAYLRKNAKRIYFETPTYVVPPKSLKNYIKFFFNNHIHKYVDRMVTDSDEVEIYGIPTIRIINGTDLSKIEPRKPTYNPSQINVMLVAYIQDYHGVDKIINAINSYNANGGTRKVFFHIVGYGPKLEYYQNLVKENGLSENVKFYGKLAGKNLDDVYNTCEIGISSLSNKEIGVTFSSTLKSKEYLSKGIPVLADVMLDVFYENPKYYFWQLKDTFNMEELLDFYDSVYKERDKMEIINEIRAFAEETCDMYKVLKQIDEEYDNSLV